MAEQEIRLPKTRKLEKPSPLRAGMRTDITGKPIKNVILLSLPDREFNLLRPYLEYVDLPHHRILHEAGERRMIGFEASQLMGPKGEESSLQPGKKGGAHH